MFISLNCICLFSFLLSLIFLINKKTFKYNIYFLLTTAILSISLYFIDEKYDLTHFFIILLISPAIAFLFIFNIFATIVLIKKTYNKMKKNHNIEDEFYS